MHPILPVRLMRMCESKCQVQQAGNGERGQRMSPSAQPHLSGHVPQRIHTPRATPVSAVRTELSFFLHSFKPSVSGYPSWHTYLKYYKFKALATTLHDLKKSQNTGKQVKIDLCSQKTEFLHHDSTLTPNAAKIICMPESTKLNSTKHSPS